MINDCQSIAMELVAEYLKSAALCTYVVGSVAPSGKTKNEREPQLADDFRPSPSLAGYSNHFRAKHRAKWRSAYPIAAKRASR